MKRRSIVLLGITHTAAILLGAILSWLTSARIIKSPLSATLMAAYSAENVRVSLRNAPAETAEKATLSHLALLDELRDELGDEAYFADKLVTASALAVRHEQDANREKANKTFEDARQTCRARGMMRCSDADLRELGSLAR